MGGNLPPLVRAFRERNEPLRQPAASLAKEPAASADPVHSHLEPVTSSAVSPLLGYGRGDASSEWPRFPEETGYADRLRANVSVLTKLILMASGVGVTAAEIWQDRWPDAPVRLGAEEVQTVRAEAAAVCLRFIGDIADKHLLPLDKRSLMGKLETSVANELESVHGVDARRFLSALQERYSQYQGYKKLEEGNDASANAIMGEFSKKIANTIGVGENPFFNETVSVLLLRLFGRWGVPDLLQR